MRFAGLLAPLGVILWSMTASPLTAQGCTALDAGSRWVAAASSAVPTHAYGTGETWIATFAGAATVPGKVFLFDEGKPSVAELSATLKPQREFGRAGSGPGEISGGMNLRLLVEGTNHNFVGADPATIVILIAVRSESTIRSAIHNTPFRFP